MKIKKLSESKKLKESVNVTYLEKELADKSDNKRIDDAYQSNDLTIVKNGDVWYLEGGNTSNSLFKIVKAEMKKHFPELTYLYDKKPYSKSMKENWYEDHLDAIQRKTSGYDRCYKIVKKARTSNPIDWDALDDARDHFGYDLYKMCLDDVLKEMGNLDEAFKPSDSGIQSVKCYNQYNYTIQELRVDNDKKTFERGQFTAGKPDKKTKNRQEFEDIVDNLKELGYTEIESDYNSMRNKSRKGVATNESVKIFGAKAKNDLTEASYGGAYDIADDQYFTKDDLMSFAEEVLGHVSETFNGLYDIGGVWFEKGNLITTIVDESDDEFTNITKIDMRKIKEPWHLKRAYAMKIAADIIEQIKDLESDVITEDVDSINNPKIDMPEPGLGTGLSNAIIALINDEWEAIEGYNSFIATLAAEEALPEAIDVIKDIANEENLHVGQLQKLLQMISPNADSIAEGEKEADRQVQEFNNEEIKAEVTED